MVQDPLRAPRQEKPEPIVLDVEEDEDAGLAAGVLDLEVGLVALAGLGGHRELGGDPRKRRPEPFFDPGQDLGGLHRHRTGLAAAAGQELLDLVDLLGHVLSSGPRIRPR